MSTRFLNSEKIWVLVSYKAVSYKKMCTSRQRNKGVNVKMTSLRHITALWNAIPAKSIVKKDSVTNSVTDFWHAWRTPLVPKVFVHEFRHGLLSHLAKHFSNTSCQNIVKRFRHELRHGRVPSRTPSTEFWHVWRSANHVKRSIHLSNFKSWYLA